jgi:hypothetical protein
MPTRAARAVLYPTVIIASATSLAAASGIAVAASSKTSSRAPGISRAIASPLPTGKNGGRRPRQRATQDSAVVQVSLPGARAVNDLTPGARPAKAAAQARTLPVSVLR